MRYYELRVDPKIKFNSMHTIDYAEWKPKLKLLSDYDLIFVKNNSINVMCDSEKHTVKANEAFLACPGQTACIQPHSEHRAGVTVLHFSASQHNNKSLSEISNIIKNHMSSSVYNSYLYLSTHIRFKYDTIHNILDVMLKELKYRRFGHKNKLDLCVVELLYELHRTCAEKILYGNTEYNYNITNAYARKIIDFLHNNYMQKITGSDIEASLNLSYDYANIIFKRITGYTIMNYLNNIRMNRAKDLMDSTSMNLYDIASLVGFKDPHYFSKKFKDFEGIPPSQFKKE